MPRRGDISVVVANAFAKREDHELALDAGCASFLTKPLDLTVLLQQAHQRLDVD